jgi:serine/threonine-protein kinase
VFVCYAHRDSASVYADLVELHDKGIRLWYDEGIPAGTSWRGEIAAAIKGAQHLIFFISDASLKSNHCLREVDYALTHNVDIIPVYLEDCSLPAELDLVLNRVHALFKARDSMYMDHLLGALKGDRGLAALLPVTRKRTLKIGLPLLLIALAALPLLMWLKPSKTPFSEPAGSVATAAPSAYDRYLEGLKLMERWDKDDNLETATDLFRKAATLDPGFALAHARLADALRLRYAITREETWLNEAVENANEAMRLNADLAPVQVAMGRIRATQGNYDLASAALERALAIDPNDASANQAMATVFERQGRLQDAEAAFKKAVALDPDNLLIRDSYANFLFRQGRFEDAADQWRAIIRIAPDHFGALVNLGAALNELGDVSEAITMYERAIEIRPTYMAYSNLGTSYGRAKRYPEAIKALRKALEIDDTDWLAWGNLGYSYSWMHGEDPQATEAFDRAIQLAEAARQENPRDPYVNSDLALYYAKTGQAERAQQRLETALTLAPDSGEILAAAAEVYELAGNRDRAVDLAKKSMESGFPRQRFQRNPEFAGLLTDPRMQDLP